MALNFTTFEKEKVRISMLAWTRTAKVPQRQGNDQPVPRYVGQLTNRRQSESVVLLFAGARPWPELAS
jgi:hypothetical protein